MPASSALPRLTTAAAAALLVAAPALRAQRATPGLTYTIHARRHQVMQGAAPGTQQLPDASWGGTVVWADGRGRMDVTEGTTGDVYEKGDYVLFDSSSYIVVRPSVHAFYMVAPIDQKMFQQRGITFAFSDAHASLDRLGAGQPIAGRSTSRFRTHISYTMEMKAAALPPGETLPSTHVDMTTESWYAETGHAVPAPFTSAVGEILGPMAPMMAGVVAVVKRARAGLPADRQVLRSVTASRSTTPIGATAGFDLTYEYTPAAAAQVDLARLVLPSDIHEAPMPGASELTGGKLQSPDDGKKWRKTPKSDQR